ncbi:hypothetical protein K437DRAFT_253033 [Tilletiaria anomala UBC 951]|uniref:Carbohydrate kinase PfkB domain-containing protein n=1 Tax=Tilletiaria anomala (strain ATCC 24038 / CBS 436.72 / UBC 951) TaxID=1037660 RepID=A0A066WQT5_TILAU|nr:uncharacterized protein K437DRAFT_253033 [Tilletiaria anomala UBC 951]KDN53339.1 hypothetical protein K437DRAFT_253033 [Tilletiaria anomala UBC 951]
MRIGAISASALRRAALQADSSSLVYSHRHISRKKETSPSNLLRISPAVQDALATNKPVVALESTIISHGLPYPQNIETALAVEAAIMEEGGIPATTALIDGYAHVGLDREQLQRLANPADGDKPVKTSRRDMAQVLALGQGGVGGTTVSGTMVLANMAGIDIFATGGIGGVHRGAQDSMDVSADLTELSRTPVAVFCSGAKSILDIPRTLEYLETQGVSVSAFRQSSTPAAREKESEAMVDFPAFYSAHSGCSVPLVRSASHAASIIHASKSLLGLSSGLVFGVPIPTEYDPAGQAIQSAVEQAVKESIELGIDKRGKQVTPWLLKRVKELSTESVKSNIALVVNNSRVAARTAVELCRLREDPTSSSKIYLSAQPSQEGLEPPAIVLFGGVVLDVSAKPAPGVTAKIAAKTTAAGSVRLSLGGVGRNMAQAAQGVIQNMPHTGGEVQLVAPLADDSTGHYVRTVWEGDTNALRLDGLFSLRQGRCQTPTASLLLRQDGDLQQGIVDTSLLEGAFTSQIVERFMASNPSTIGFDSNMCIDAMAHVLTASAQADAFVLCEPTSVAKSSRVVHALHHAGFLGKRHVLGGVTPNVLELMEMHDAAQELLLAQQQQLQLLRLGAVEKQIAAGLVASSLLPDTRSAEAALSVARLLGPLFLTLGPRGVLAVVPRSTPLEGAVEITHVPPPTILAPSSIVNTTGAGDTFAGALLALVHLQFSGRGVGNESRRPRQHLLKNWLSSHGSAGPSAVHDLLCAAQFAALATLQSHGAVGNMCALRGEKSFWRAVGSQGKA